MKRAVLAISALGFMVLSALQMGLVVPASAEKQLSEFKIAQAASDKTTGGAADNASAAPASSIIGSAVNGGECIRPTKEMRKIHMDLLLHKRDKTMRKGIRTKDSSLKQCVSCHAIKGDDGAFIKSSNPKHFCRGCHDQVAVKLDCFECHASRPEMKDGGHASLNPHKRLSPLALVQGKKATETALNSFLGGQANDK